MARDLLSQNQVNCFLKLMPSPLDDALELLHQTDSEYGSGLSNHGPMVAEAMVTLNRPDAVLPWVERYRKHLRLHQDANQPIAANQWRAGLGDLQRVSDWVSFFDQELGNSSWQGVLQNWVPLLAPGLAGAATHGIIRTGHAVRSLANQPTSQRLHELAEGLGYWAASFQQLPGIPSDEEAHALPSQAIEHVQRVNDANARLAGLITEQLRGLEQIPSFSLVINWVSVEGDLSQFLSDLTTTFTRVYLANRKNLIAFVHSVTAPSALRLLLPYLSEADARLAARYAWQASAALYAWYDVASENRSVDPTPPTETIDDLIDAAISTGGAHTIKLTEVCLREYAVNPDPIYLVAARDAIERVGNV
jgi:hypothetical protein